MSRHNQTQTKPVSCSFASTPKIVLSTERGKDVKSLRENLSPAVSRSLSDLDVVCFSHLRWHFVFQRPQHLLTRFSANQKVFFVEEPVFEDNIVKTLSLENVKENIVIVTPKLPHGLSGEEVNHALAELLAPFFSKALGKQFLFWYYTPMALEFTRDFSPITVVYDCMDELTGFAGAPHNLKQLEQELFDLADVVFTGGRSIYEAKKECHANIHSMPSSIDKDHFMTARNHPVDPADQSSIMGPRFGFYGVIDERFDINLLREAAIARPDWQFVILGPVVKIDFESLPQMENIHYLGGKSYAELPKYLGNWDVAIMPFALNDSTKYISPTKTPEFLAGGKPVVSTAITDVINPYEREGLVSIARSAEEFIQACETALSQRNDKIWLKRVDEFLANISWDMTCETMQRQILLSSQRSRSLLA